MGAQTICLLCEGVMVLIFANTANLAGSIVVLVFFSLFVQAAEGTSYGIVPYVDPPNTGSIAGIIGAGGNTGAYASVLDFVSSTIKRRLSLWDLLSFAHLFSLLESSFLVMPAYSGAKMIFPNRILNLLLKFLIRWLMMTWRNLKAPRSKHFIFSCTNLIVFFLCKLKCIFLFLEGPQVKFIYNE